MVVFIELSGCEFYLLKSNRGIRINGERPFFVGVRSLTIFYSSFCICVKRSCFVRGPYQDRKTIELLVMLNQICYIVFS